MSALLGIDVGTKRIGVATADTTLPIAVPLTTVLVDGDEIQEIARLIEEKSASLLVVGYPRNQSGDPTEQTNLVETFVEKLRPYAQVEFQDESLTSVMAEQRLKAGGKPYEKGEIDALAAAIILQDYLEVHHAA